MEEPKLGQGLTKADVRKKVGLSVMTIRHEVEEGLDHFKRLKRYTDSGFRQAEKELRDRHQSLSDDMDPDERQFLSAVLHMEENDAVVTLPALRNGSLLLSIYGFMEHYLEAVCHLFHFALTNSNESFGRPNLSLTEVRGRGIRRAEDYLTKVVHLCLPEFFGDNSLLLNELRNAFAHRTGNINDPQKNKIEKLKLRVLEREQVGWSELTHFEIAQNLDGTHRVELKNFFTEGMLDNIESMFGELFKRVDQRLSELME